MSLCKWNRRQGLFHLVKAHVMTILPKYNGHTQIVDQNGINREVLWEKMMKDTKTSYDGKHDAVISLIMYSTANMSKP